MDPLKDRIYIPYSWSFPPTPPLALLVADNDFPGPTAFQEAEGSWVGRRHPLHGAMPSLVSSGVPGTLVALIRYLHISLLLLLLLLYYPVTSPSPPVTMPSRPSIGGSEGEGRVQHGSGLPSRTHSSENVTFRRPLPPSDYRAGGSDDRNVTDVIVSVTIYSCRNKDSKSSSSSSQPPPLSLSCRDNS